MLHFLNDRRILIEQTPYDKGITNLDEPNQGVEVDTTGKEVVLNRAGEIVYQHLNKQRSTEDTYINLTVNKLDKATESYIDGVILGISSDLEYANIPGSSGNNQTPTTPQKTLLDKGGNQLDLIMTTQNGGEVSIDYKEYIKDKINKNTIRVPGIGIDGNEMVFNMTISELEVDKSTTTGYKVKDGTTVKLRLIFRYYDGEVRLTNVESYYGNNLIKNKGFSSTKDDDLGIFLSNINIDLWTNFAEIGNLSLDFKKQDISKNELIKAYYDVKVTNPDGTVLRKQNIEVKNGDLSSDIELQGLAVNVDSIIEITEKQAPIGYGINETETLRVADINEEGEITLEHIDSSYKTSRLSLDKTSATTTTSGNLKTNYEVTLTDYALDTFIFGIEAIDASSKEKVQGYSFDVSSNLGAQKMITTRKDGKGVAKIGGNIEDGTITYTITPKMPAEYYKLSKIPTEVKVVFDISGNVDVNATMNAQTDINYGKTWNINKVETIGEIEIQLLLEHQDPLNVQVETLDRITGEQISDVDYKITESKVLPATGTGKAPTIQVGYALETGVKTYKLDETRITGSYANISSKSFQIQYKDGIITQAEITNDIDEDAVITKTGNLSVKITVYAEPKVPFEISNKYYFDNIALQGAKFEVTSISNNESATGTTNASGITGMYCDISGVAQEKIYKVKQTSAAVGYATVEDFYIKVHYTDDKLIDSAELTDKDGNVITNKFIQVSFRVSESEYNRNNKGIVTLQVLNYPEFKLNIKNVDRRNNNPIVGTNYSVSSTYIESDNSTVNFTSTKEVVTDTTGIGVAHLDKTKENTIVAYKIKEDTPATGYQSYRSDIDIQVTYDAQGFVTDANFIDGTKINGQATITLPTTKVDERDNFVVNVELRNNPILKFNLTAIDAKDHNVKIKDIGFQIVATQNNTVCSNSSAINRVNKTDTPETSYTDINGFAASYLDRTIENSTIYYTITETKKSPGYEWAGEDIVIAVTYDGDGKISDATVTSGVSQQEHISETWLDKENFEITLDILNNEIKEFGISLTATDAYDTDKKLSDMKVEAFLIDQGANSESYVSDGQYELIGDNSLLTGADRNQDNLPDITYGEDYKTIGAYEGGAGTRTLRLVIKNDSQNGYYVKGNNKENVGYYIGSTYKDKGVYYQTVQYQYLIDVTFDDNGKITKAKLKNSGEYVSGLGWVVDNQYVKVINRTEDDIDHTDYKLNINLKFFPMFNLNAIAMDNYTYTDQTEKGNEPDSLKGASFTVSTSRKRQGTAPKDEYIEVGYIGEGHYYNITDIVYGSIYNGTNSLYVPIEKNKTRLFYVFENNEPTNYQTMKPRDSISNLYEDRLIAIIKVTFNEKGEIVNLSREEVCRINQNGDKIMPYQGENGAYLSHNNIKEYNYYVSGNDEANRDMNFYIGYALTTSITVRAIDDISGDPITNIRMYPWKNNTYSTKDPYVYNSSEKYYRNTGSNGRASWKYWGAAIDSTTNSYIIGSEREKDSYKDDEKYNGYLFPNDMASTTLGGSGNEADYYTKLDVTYGEDGKISNVTSVGHDLWGDDNTSNITWDPATGHIYVDMLYSRKFQVRLNKADYYDSTINNLSASFNVISNKGLKTTINSMKMTCLGKVYKNEVVKYTLSETIAPSGYYPLEKTIDFYVTFDQDGNIGTRSIKTDDPNYFEVISTSQSTKSANKTSPDLTIAVKDKPAFMLDLRVIDKFYKNDGIRNIYLNITNSKGDKATGNPQTDSRGYANSQIVGPVYPDEEVIYYITQTNKAPEYYLNNTTIELHVKYNTAGKIEKYWIENGKEVVNNFDGSKFNNKRKISMDIMNMPEALKIGLYKYNDLTKAPIEDVPFTITAEDIQTGKVEDLGRIVTQANGEIVEKIDTFNTSLSGKVIKYTIHEDEVPNTFRKIEDIVFLIRYNADGSMASCNQIENQKGILNTKVKLDMATDGKIRYLGDTRVHFKIEVPNDNTFDLIIRNQDINYEKLGIEGSKFDVSINGVTYNPKATDANGKTMISNITESGDLVIDIAQREVGEGHKYDVDNTATINLQKGMAEYSLDLNPSQDGFIDDKNAVTTKAIIKVDEEYGTVEVTFKNETKTELTILKQDVNTSASLENAIFEVTKVELDSNGDEKGNKELITTSENNTTNKDGIIHFELGVAPQSTIYKYTFKEITPPEGYNPIVDLEMKVTYDQYGRISNLESNEMARLIPVMATDNYNCHSIYAIIKNGDISPAYTVKVVTEDANSRKRINGSKIQLNITDVATGNLIAVQPKTVASAKNPSTSETGNLAIDGQKYTDAQLAALAVENKDPIILEKGLTYIDNIDFEGTINIAVSQQKTAYGYIYGDQRTDGNIKIKATYEPHLGKDPTVDFQIIDNDGFGSAVKVDNTNRIITITLLNESNVLFNIKTQTYGENPLPIEGVSYSITSEIFTATDTIKTDLNETTTLSDKEGKTIGNAKNALAGKTVIYTIHQNIPEGYQSIDDIQIEVRYDLNGYIKDIEALSSEDNISIDYEKAIGKREIDLNVYNKKFIGDYKTFIEKHATDTDEEQNKYGVLLPGAKYHIIINQEDSGTESIEWTAITDENGLIEVPYTLNGFGYITITIEELEAPEGYKTDTARTLRLYRNKDTGEITLIEGIVNFDRNEDNTEVYLKPLDEQLEDKYTLIINKYSKLNNKRITNNQAKFKAELTKKDDEGNITYQEEIEDIYTDKTGKATMDNIKMPEEGTYTLKITETDPPEGYKAVAETIEIPVTFTKDKDENTIISAVNIEGQENVSISTFKDQLIGINLYDDPDLGLDKDEYSLDITKVDGQTMQGIEPMAIFKVWLPDEKETAVYTETKTTVLGPGKLDYCYIEQDKDYEVRLTHMKKPTVDEIKASPEQKVTQEYTFEEVVAPDGYALETELLTLEVEFGIKVNADGVEEVIITDAKTNDKNKFALNNVQEQALSADIINNEQASEFKVHYEPNTQDPVNDLVNGMPADQIKQAGAPLTLAANIPTREGYTFKEWNTNSDGSGSTFKPADTYALDADITLYAIWEVAEYKIHYEQNPPIDPTTKVAVGLVTNMPDDQTKTHNIDITLDNDEKTPTIPNVANYYKFTGWNTVADGTGTHYDEKQVYNLNADLELYAQWDYIIRYNANVPTDKDGFPLTTPAKNIPKDQSESINSTQDAIIDDLNVYTNAPTMEGYVFKEWNTKTDGTGNTYNPNDTYKSRQGIDLYAIWQYEIKYDKNTPLDENGFVQNIIIGNMPASPQIENVNTTAKIANSTPTTQPDNYIFKEWNTKADGTGNSYKPDDEYSGNIGVTLYAIWEKSQTNRLYLKSLVEDYMITDVEIDDSSRYTKIKYNTSNKQEYVNEDKYIVGIYPQTVRKNPNTEQSTGTTLKALKDNLDTNGIIKVYKDDDGDDLFDPQYDIEISDTDLVGSGMFLNVTKDNEEITLRIVVRGDNKDGDGIFYQPEYQAATKYINNNNHNEITKDYYRIALDVELNGTIRATDIQAMLNMKQLACKYACNKTIELTLDTNGGTLKGESVTYVYKNGTYAQNITYKELPKVEKQGYTFIGWFDENGNQVNGNTVVQNTAKHTLYARFN